MKQSQHIDKVFQRQTSKIIAENRLRLKTSIEALTWLTLQGCALRGNDETVTSMNRGNFVELIKLLSSYNNDVKNVVLENAPGNAQYIAPSIQKEILYIFARRVRSTIREEIGNSKYCIIIDESRDESMREQMAVLRFVDKESQIQEKFIDLVHVSDTTALTLKNKITFILSHQNLDANDIRGQGYDGASNMRGEFKGLQALFLRECPYAYYIHCLAHRLQLALVAVAREVKPVYTFFTDLTYVVNIIIASAKRHDQLRDAQASNIANLIANDELETGSGLNQVGTLQQAGDTRWGSHLASIRSLLKMYDAIRTVLQNIIDEGNYSRSGDAHKALRDMTSFEFIFILHLMKDILEITHDLCEALQLKSQDILNALSLVSTSKTLIWKKREEGWEIFLEEVTSFFQKNSISIPDMNAPYVFGRSGRTCQEVDSVSIEHHYRIKLFVATIDTQWQELNSRFNEKAIKLLSLSSTFDPKDNYKLLDVNQIVELATKFYPSDFDEQELMHLKVQAQHYQLDIPQRTEFQNLSSISDLCQQLKRMGKHVIYSLVDRLIRLILTLPVTTATAERSFSAMKLVKTRLRNKMEDDFLTDTLISYINREIVEKIDVDSIINDFYDMKECRVQLR